MQNNISHAHCIGQDASHICAPQPPHIRQPVHADIIDAFKALQADASEAGFELQIVSGYRDYARQQLIWTGKAKGQRVLLDEKGKKIRPSTLSNEELLFAILRWSALPGASRHHWGTDIDVYDAAAVGADYSVQLSAEEVADEGVFGPFHQWLDQRITQQQAHGFFRPYAKETGGVSPERWHLSYAPLAYKYQQQLDPDYLWEVWERNELLLLREVKANWERIWSKYIQIDSSCYPESVSV